MADNVLTLLLAFLILFSALFPSASLFSLLLFLFPSSYFLLPHHKSFPFFPSSGTSSPLPLLPLFPSSPPQVKRKELDDPHLLSADIVLTLLLAFRDVQDYDGMVELFESANALR